METKDVIVIGSGGAGLTVAVVAATQGLKVLVAEKADCFGGTTALSGGGMWVPMSRAAVMAGFKDSKKKAARYVENVVGPTLDKTQLDAFLDNAPKMLDYLEAHSAVRFSLQSGFPDWEPGVEGAMDDGRMLIPDEYDGKKLGDYFAKLRPPLAEFNAPGGFMVCFKDLPHMMNAFRSFKSFLYIAKHSLRFAFDRLHYPRGTRLTMGNALIGRLLRSALDAGVELWDRASVVGLLREGNRITGAVIERDVGKVEVAARRGVVLASGGFSANPEMRAKFIPYAEHHVSLVPETNTGDGLNMAKDVGGIMEEENISNGVWTVMSLATHPNGSVSKFPHMYLDRPKPGCIAVNVEGKRFGDEAAINMGEDIHSSGSVPAYLVCDHKFIKKYGLGMVLPWSLGLKKWIKQLYIVTAPTLTELAGKIGVDPKGLKKTVGKMNEYAADGYDPDFSKGGTALDISMGDPDHKPNPCLGPVKTAPFYAVKIYPGHCTTTLGMRVDMHARVVDDQGNPIPGLYAVGLDMNSLWRGAPPGSGSNNTLSMTFGYIAARHIAGSAASDSAA